MEHADTVECFDERDGRYLSKPIQSTGGKSPALRIVLSFLPVILMAGIFVGLSDTHGNRDSGPLIFAAAILVFTNLIALLVRKFSMSGRIAVDQMQGTVTFARAGGKRKTVNTGELDRITIAPLNRPDGNRMVTRGKPWTALSLRTSMGDSHTLMSVQGDASRLRQLADELSVLTSVSVSVEA